MMEYRVWLYGATTYAVCEDTESVHALVATSAGPCRVEVYQLALLRVDTYGLAGGPPLPQSLPFANTSLGFDKESEGSGPHLASQAIMHMSLAKEPLGMPVAQPRGSHTSLGFDKESEDVSLANTSLASTLGAVQGKSEEAEG